MARSFCPVIRVKCRRAYSQAKDPGGLKAGRARSAKKYAAFKAAKAKLRKAMGFKGFGNVHPQAESTSLPPATVVQAVARAQANPVVSCTVMMGGKKWKLKGAKVGSKIAELMRAQRSGGCCSPKVVR